METSIIFSIIILILSVVIHEVSHGYAALLLGDVTAKYAGRLTLNPLKHLDPMGSIIVPLILAILPGGFIVGWAKPVPYNPYNLKNQRWGELLVALAGPVSNILIALLFGALIRFAVYLDWSESFIWVSLNVIFINLFLAVFNLVPIPPLDGSKVFFGLFPKLAYRFRAIMERHFIILFLIFVFFFSGLIVPVVIWLTSILTGLNLGF